MKSKPISIADFIESIHILTSPGVVKATVISLLVEPLAFGGVSNTPNGVRRGSTSYDF